MLRVRQYAWISSNSVATMHLRKQTCSLIEYAKMARLLFVVLTHKLYGSVCLGNAMMYTCTCIQYAKIAQPPFMVMTYTLYAPFVLDIARQQEFRSVSNTCSRYQDLNTNNHCVTTAYDLYLNFQTSITLIKELRRILRLQFIVTILPNSH
jgi:hypothetical protein